MTNRSILIGLVGLAGLLFAGALRLVLRQPEDPAADQPDDPRSVAVAKSAGVGKSIRAARRRAEPRRAARSRADNEVSFEKPVLPPRALTWPPGIAQEVYGSSGLADSLARAMNDPSSRDVSIEIDCTEFPCLVHYLGEKVVPADMDRMVQEISAQADGEEVAIESFRSSSIAKGGSVTHASFFSFYPKSIQTEAVRAKTQKRLRDAKDHFESELNGA